jgi:hypothetical protein
MVLSTSFAEPPSLTYGVPSYPSGWETISPGYSYEPLVGSTHYTSHAVGHIPSEGAHIDSKLLNTVKQVILAHENSQSVVSKPNSLYGVPKSTYGPPSHGWQPWTSSRVTDLWFDHPTQSLPVAYYIGHESYAPAHKGWQPASKGWEVTASKGWEAPAYKGWEAPAYKGWEAPKKTVVIQVPKQTYGVPRW